MFVPSYFDYVRLRAFLEEQGADFLGLSEYTDGSEAARGRSSFAGRCFIVFYKVDNKSQPLYAFEARNCALCCHCLLNPIM